MHTPSQVVHELIERFEAHLTARQYFSVIANMKGTSPEEVASRLLNVPGLEGLQVSEMWVWLLLVHEQ